jgi:hypothetical protein
MMLYHLIAARAPPVKKGQKHWDASALIFSFARDEMNVFILLIAADISDEFLVWLAAQRT